MFKTLLILLLFFFLLFRLGGFLFRLLFGGLQKQDSSGKGYRKENVNVHGSGNASKRKKEGYSGGEYIDFEEVDERS